MPLLILLALIAANAIIIASENSGKRSEPLTKDDLDAISDQIRGKSQAEAKKIIKEYKH